MGRFNRYQSDQDLFGKCAVCSGVIHLEHYFSIGEFVICETCGTEHILGQKYPVILTYSNRTFDPKDYFMQYSSGKLFVQNEECEVSM